MSIQDRLKKQRYGEYNIKAPTKEDLDDYGLRVTKLRKPMGDTFDKIIYQMRNPPHKDKYYDQYIKTVERYMDYLYNATKQSRWQSMAQIVDLHLAGKLIYMNSHPGRFHEFVQFRYSWMYNVLCAMRTYIIGRRYKLGEIFTNNSTAQWSAGFEPWPKPMGQRAMGLLANNVYDLVQQRVSIIISRSVAL